MNNIYYDNENSSMARVGELKYGTIITGFRGNPKCIYMKVNKRELGEGLYLNTRANRQSVLMNLKIGTLRIVAGNEPVIVLDADIKLRETRALLDNLKEEYRDTNKREEEDC